ncbi:MAG: hypothetical protein KGZ25_10045, partial [Planctomycetes bacterium]|nr:hypothetical protein [Planctomycetota bacterium]
NMRFDAVVTPVLVLWAYGGYLAYQARAVGALLPRKYRKVAAKRVVLLVCLVTHATIGILYLAFFELNIGRVSGAALGFFPGIYLAEALRCRGGFWQIAPMAIFPGVITLGAMISFAQWDLNKLMRRTFDIRYRR